MKDSGWFWIILVTIVIVVIAVVGANMQKEENENEFVSDSAKVADIDSANKQDSNDIKDEIKVEVPQGAKNAVTLEYKDNKNGTLTLTVSIKGDVEFAGFTGELRYDTGALTYVSSSKLFSGSGNVNSNKAGTVSFSFASSENVTTAQNMFNVTFSYGGPVNTHIGVVIEDGDFANAELKDVQYVVIGGDISIKR